jgi:hypothetical protein
MVKKQSTYRGKGGAEGDDENVVTESFYTRSKNANPKTWIVGKIFIAVLVIAGTFVGTWAILGFSTSLNSLSIATLATEILYNIIILPWIYYKSLSKIDVDSKTGVKKSLFSGAIKPWGLLLMLGIWVGVGLLIALGLGGTDSNYVNGIIPGIALAGIAISLIGSIDVFRSIGVSTLDFLGKPITSVDDESGPNIIEDASSEGDGSEHGNSYGSNEFARSIRSDSIFSDTGSTVQIGGKRRSHGRRNK